MSDMAMMRDELVGGHLFLVEEGVVIGSAVSKTFFPGSGWLNAGKIQEVRFRQTQIDDDSLDPSEGGAGGYELNQRKIVTGDFMQVVLRNFNEWVHRMQWGLSAAIAEDTNLTPFETIDRQITGVMKLQGRRQTGADLVRGDCWVEARLIETPPWAAKFGVPVLELQKKYSALNTLRWPAVA